MTFLAFIGAWQILLVLFVLILPLMALISALKNQFDGNDKIIWVLLIIILPILGALLYFMIGRGKRINQ